MYRDSHHKPARSQVGKALENRNAAELVDQVADDKDGDQEPEERVQFASSRTITSSLPCRMACSCAKRVI